ncbi:hypothetical protein EYF80_028917 [Liparis tanakae]|uniref:Uncharacterized protein n=1 Tax=Liparis tanakae TaxID=230148 RepID=A0A4Z2H834_9TELE|nr:hypothetical protein EYF80_028917 [Liparis tanakae]
MSETTGPGRTRAPVPALTCGPWASLLKASTRSMRRLGATDPSMTAYLRPRRRSWEGKGAPLRATVSTKEEEEEESDRALSCSSRDKTMPWQQHCLRRSSSDRMWTVLDACWELDPELDPAPSG